MRSMTARLFAVFRAAIVAPLFIALWMYFLPRWLAGQSAFTDPRPPGWIVVVIGAAIGLPCVWQFAWRGIGTPAPFDPPRRLVVSGPYRFVRNPMYLGMAVAILGEAIVFPHSQGVLLLELALAALLVTAFVRFYEEPALRRMFGAEYEAYCSNVRRWVPRFRPWDPSYPERGARAGP
jgi:protein-S-isoprenylcysteine O-methyltransferase Ste14